MWLTDLGHTSYVVAPNSARTPNSKDRETQSDTTSDDQHTGYSFERAASEHHFFCESQQREANAGEDFMRRATL